MKYRILASTTLGNFGCIDNTNIYICNDIIYIVFAQIPSCCKQTQALNRSLVLYRPSFRIWYPLSSLHYRVTTQEIGDIVDESGH